MAAFLAVAKPKKLTFLLPDPTEREVKRHISERSREVLKALREAKRRAPFLAKWKDWPIKKDKADDSWLVRDLSTLAEKEWTEFLGNFEVQRLGYKGLDLREIMDWYDKARAPFGAGKKRKEFPDALALASILNHTKTTKTSVAIISKDLDFQNACHLYAELLYYPSLPAITEAFLSGDARVEKMKGLVSANIQMLEDAVIEDFANLDFAVEQPPNGVVNYVNVDNVNFDEFRVVGLGNNECSVAFSAGVDFTANVDYEIPYYDNPYYAVTDEYFSGSKRSQGMVSDWAEITGTAKLRVSEAWDAVLELKLLVIDGSDIYITRKPDWTSLSR